MFVISQSVCPLQAFAAQSNVHGKGRSLPELSTIQVLHSKLGFWLYPQILDQSGKACQGQTLSIIKTFVIYRVESFITYGPECEGQFECNRQWTTTHFELKKISLSLHNVPIVRNIYKATIARHYCVCVCPTNECWYSRNFFLKAQLLLLNLYRSMRQFLRLQSLIPSLTFADLPFLQ